LNKTTSKSLEIRTGVAADAAAIESLYPQAFPEEDLLPLVRDLLLDSAVAISLVGTIDAELVAHVIFTHCGVTGSSSKAALLAPLAVDPAWQRQGIGSTLVRAGLQRLKETDVDLVLVLGNPAYYRRLGFKQEDLVQPPYELPSDWSTAWQSRYLTEDAQPISGKLAVPDPWRQTALWAP